MTGTPTDPDDPNLTTLYDPPPPDTPTPPQDTPDTPTPPPDTPDTPTPPADTPTPTAPPPAARAVAAPASKPIWRSRGWDSGRTGTIVFGVLLVAVGLWFFADQTLGLDMPRLRWSELWPILIITLGGWIVLGSMRRDR